MKCLKVLMPRSTTSGISFHTCSPHQVTPCGRNSRRAALPAFWCQACSASTSDWPGAGRQKSTIIVVPPEKRRARAGGEIVGGVVPMKGISIWVCGSMPPGMT